MNKCPHRDPQETIDIPTTFTRRFIDGNDQHYGTTKQETRVDVEQGKLEHVEGYAQDGHRNDGGKAKRRRTKLRVINIRVLLQQLSLHRARQIEQQDQAAVNGATAPTRFAVDETRFCTA